MSRDEDEEQRQSRLYDRRVVERNIKKGLLTWKEYEAHLKTLPDAAEKAAPPGEEPPSATITYHAPISHITVLHRPDADEVDLDDIADDDDEDEDEDDEDEDEDETTAKGTNGAPR